MNCPHCESIKTRKLPKPTQLDYPQFLCRHCQRQFNERTGTALNFIEYRTEIVMLVVHHYYRFKLSLDNVVELMATRGITLSHQTVHNWVHQFGVSLGLNLRSARKHRNGKKWNVDATYIKIDGRWCYLYRAIDKQGDLVDVYLSDTRDQKAAETFFEQCHSTTGVTPEQMTTDQEKALYPAVANTFPDTYHRDSKYMNNVIEQDHRGIKSRWRPMKGFSSFLCALVFCTVFEEIRQLFRMEGKTRSERRSLLMPKFQEFEKYFNTI